MKIDWYISDNENDYKGRTCLEVGKEIGIHNLTRRWYMKYLEFKGIDDFSKTREWRGLLFMMMTKYFLKNADNEFLDVENDLFKIFKRRRKYGKGKEVKSGLL